MKNSKFLETLRTLNKRELTAFAKYLDGNYGNDKIALAVFGYIKAFFPDYRDEKKLEIAYAYQHIFDAAIQDNTYNRKKLLNALSDLNQWLKEFLLWEKVKDKSLESQALWISVAKERGLKEESDKQLEKIRQTITTSNKKSATDLLIGLLANYYVYYQAQDKKSAPNTNALIQCTTDLDKYFAVNRMKMACEMASLQNLQILHPQPEMAVVVKDIAKWPHVQLQLLFQIYHEVYALITEKDESVLKTIELWLYENYQYIDNEELHIILSYVHNFTTAQSKLNKTTFVPLAHRLNKFAVEHGFFIKKNAMSSTQFTNIVNTACKQKDFEWASFFIDTQDSLLKEEQRSDTIQLAKAIVLFSQEKFEDSYNFLRGLEFVSLEHAIQSRIFIIRCLFELNLGQELFYSTCEAFEVFLYRKQNTRPEIVKPSMNFIRLITHIYKGKMPPNELIEKIKTIKPLYAQDWLLEKMDKYTKMYAAQKRKDT